MWREVEGRRQGDSFGATVSVQGSRCHNDGGRGRDAKRPDGKNPAHQERAGLGDEKEMGVQDGTWGSRWYHSESTASEQSWPEGKRASVAGSVFGHADGITWDTVQRCPKGS